MKYALSVTIKKFKKAKIHILYYHSDYTIDGFIFAY